MPVKRSVGQSSPREERRAAYFAASLTVAECEAGREGGAGEANGAAGAAAGQGVCGSHIVLAGSSGYVEGLEQYWRSHVE